MICTKCRLDILDEFAFCPHCGKKQVKTAAPKSLKRANGTGTVYKLSGRRKKPWAAAVRKQVIGYYEEKTDALSALEAVRVNGLPSGYNETITNVYERWKDIHFRDLTHKGTEGYETAWERLSPIHDKKMREIKTADFQRIVDSAMSSRASTGDFQPLSRSGKEKIKQLCSQLCKRAIQDDIINRNYGEFIRLERETKTTKEIFTNEDIVKLLANDSETARIIVALIYTGFRINELFSVKKSDVKLSYPNDDAASGIGAPDLSYFVGGEKTEAGRNRVVPIHAKIKPLVSRWFVSSGDFFISNTKGGMINDKNFRSRYYYPLLTSLGIDKKSPHSTRHTFASMMSAAGVRTEDLQKILGHANYSTTAEIYIHQDIEKLIQSTAMI